MEHKLYNVRALYARLHEPHNFSGAENRSMACAYDALEAKYECSFAIGEDDAKAMARAMKSAFDAAKKPDWIDWNPKGLGAVFKLATDIDGRETADYLAKTVKKTYGEQGNAPKVWLADSTEVPAGFRLTNGSICHVLIKLAPWNYAGKSGVQLRLKGVRVVQLADGPAVADPFADDPSAKNGSDDGLSAFLDDLPGQKPLEAHTDFNDEIPF